MTTSRALVTPKAVALSLAWPAIFLALYYTLAWHLRLTLGGWPKSIVVEPESLLFKLHAGFTGAFFWGASIVLPWVALIALVFAFEKKNRPSAIHLAIFVVGCAAAFGLMQLAPLGFTRWWWD